MSDREDRVYEGILCRIAEALERQADAQEQLAACICGTRPDGVQISQIVKGASMSITGTPAGGQSTFEADAILNGIADPAGFPAGSVDTWTTDDPQASMSPDQGPNNSQIVISIPLTDTQGSAPAGSPGSYNLTVSVQMPPATAGGPAPAALTMTVNVPITPAPPPVPTGVAINQIS